MFEKLIKVTIIRTKVLSPNDYIPLLKKIENKIKETYV